MDIIFKGIEVRENSNFKELTTIEPNRFFPVSTNKYNLPVRTLGKNGPAVAAIGLGCMGMSDFYGPADETESLATIHAALDAGVNVLDTGDFYGMGHNEMLLSRVLKTRRNEAFVCVKFGAVRAPDGAFIGLDLRPAAVKNFLAYSLKRLGTNHIDLYQPCRVDPSIPIEETVGAMVEMKDRGYIRFIGLSEAGPVTIRKAHAVHPISALQIEYAIVTRSIEDAIVPVTRELGISISAYGVFSRGLLSTTTKIPEAANGDFRGVYPRFQGENFQKNQRLIDSLRAIAARKGCTLAQLAVAWVLSRGNDIVPLVGARTTKRLEEALGGASVSLSSDDLVEIERAVPRGAVAGERYPVEQMAWLDSERHSR
jgi:aryl-alcohol dehydrogenase-like predicted oxidoreductase